MPDIWVSPATWGRARRLPQDVIKVVEVAAADDADLDRALRALTQDVEIRRALGHLSEVSIGGKNPYQVALAEARAYPGADAIAMLEGDHGGQTYVICPVAMVRCDEATLKRLLQDIDVVEQHHPGAARLSFFRAAVGQSVGGGMGGGFVTSGVWVHQRLRAKGLEARIAAVLAGKRPSIG